MLVAWWEGLPVSVVLHPVEGCYIVGPKSANAPTSVRVSRPSLPNLLACWLQPQDQEEPEGGVGALQGPGLRRTEQGPGGRGGGG